MVKFASYKARYSGDILPGNF